MVVPIGDEGPYRGDPVNDPGDDRDAIRHAISVASFDGVLVSPISPDNAPPTVETPAIALAAGTGGVWSKQSTVPGGIGDAIIALVEAACPVPAASADAGDDVEVCSGTRVTLDGSGSSPLCTGTIEYRWVAGPVEVCPWSATTSCAVQPDVTTIYTLELRCSDFPTCVFSDDVQVTVTPSPVPGDVGNRLFGVRAGSDVVLSWTAAAGALAHNLYRGVTKGIWPPVFLTGLPVTTTLPDVPGPPFLYFYRVTGAGCGGIEGSWPLSVSPCGWTVAPDR